MPVLWATPGQTAGSPLIAGLVVGDRRAQITSSWRERVSP
jgi:hypothetical protein